LTAADLRRLVERLGVTLAPATVTGILNMLSALCASRRRPAWSSGTSSAISIATTLCSSGRVTSTKVATKVPSSASGFGS
jgi:hypothetical protein